MISTSRNVFVLGLDAVHLAQLKALRRSREYRFHELYRRQDVKSGREDVAERLLTGAQGILANFPASVDAIVGYWDFPVSTMLPLLREPKNLPTPSFESVLKCEHKYWSRLEQARVIPEHIPEFCVVDPFHDDVKKQITVAYPFWIKPVKSVLSYLGFRVNSDRELEHAVCSIREGIARIATPFNYLLGFADLPDEIAQIDGRHCIVESIISSDRQCTLEGYAYGKEIVVYGAVDSIREGAHASSFARYQYPSTLPADVLRRMANLLSRFLSHIGFTDSPFNAELYWNEQTNQISLLEINTRISKSHCPLFKKVDGEFHHQVMLDVALGRRPSFPRRQGKYKVAAKFMWRVYEDARVHCVPSQDELSRLCQDIPGAEIELHLEKGRRLSELSYQDSYSYEIAVIFLGGDSETELLSKYAEVQAGIHLQLEPV